MAKVAALLNEPTPPRPGRDLEAPIYSDDEWASLIEDERVRRARYRVLCENLERVRDRELEACRDYRHWAENWIWLYDPKGPVGMRRIPLRLWDGQVELTEFLERGIDEKRLRLVNKGRELGVTWLSLSVILHRWIFELGFLATVGSRKEDLVVGRTVDSLFGKLRFMLERLPYWMQPQGWSEQATASLLSNPDSGAEILGETTNDNFARGGRRTVVMVDEFAAVEVSKQEAITIAVESVSRSFWRVSTPRGKGNRFYADFTVAPAEDTITLPWWTDPRRDLDWYESRLRRNGGQLSYDEREQEHGCSFRVVVGHKIWAVDHAIYYEDAELPGQRANTAYKLVGAMDFGSGPSATTCGLALLEYQQGALKTVWVDWYQQWSRVRADHIGTEILLSQETWYRRPAALFGDPAGAAMDADQESWETKLQRSGARVQCLPGDANTPLAIKDGLDLVQEWFDDGRLRIHARRCPGLGEAVEQWQWSLPPGVLIEHADRENIKPRKDDWSHACDMLRYLVYAVSRYYMTTGKRARPEAGTKRRRTIAAIVQGVDLA